MQSAKMDNKVTIFSRVETQNEYGELILTDSMKASVWANVVPIGGKETWMAQQIVPEAKFKMLIRYRDDLDETDKVLFQGKEYDIAYIAQIGRKEGLEVVVKFP
jgi:SPP1 family predicted phage head-tail adaptor